MARTEDTSIARYLPMLHQMQPPLSFSAFAQQFIEYCLKVDAADISDADLLGETLLVWAEVDSSAAADEKLTLTFNVIGERSGSRYARITIAGGLGVREWAFEPLCAALRLAVNGRERATQRDLQGLSELLRLLEVAASD